eukprot:1149228-Prymnesium_polylepis.1
MTAVCAKNGLSYKRLVAYFIPGRRAEQLETEGQGAAEGCQKRRRKRAERARAELALVAAVVGM